MRHRHAASARPGVNRASLQFGRREVIAGLGAAALLAARADATTPALQLTEARLIQGGWARGQAVLELALALDGRPVAKDAQGRFFIAFDRDAGPAAMLTGTAPNGRVERLPIAIAPRQWQIEQIDTPFHPPSLPDAEFLAVRKLELAQINAARARTSDSAGWGQRFVWPAQGRISGHFGSQRVYRGTPGSYHSGTDIASGAGGPIIAPAGGVVILAATQPFTLEGHLLMVDHGMALNSAFLHCSELLVRVGEAVRQGQLLARVGMTGRATGPHLHWSLKWGEARLDPELFVQTAQPGG